jgi:predicted Zn-dependent protease with MMP-like domain
MGMHLTDEEFAEVIEDAIDSIPEGFHRYLKDVAVDIEDMPDATTCAELKLRDPRTLLGLYRGTPLTQRHVEAPYRFPERIIIYQENIERICRSKTQMIDQIRRTVLHEVGHHFGLNEQQLRELGF